jgi:hypothetical protein
MESGKPETSVNAEPKTGKRLWRPGTSANPAGMKSGSRHKATLFVENLLKGQREGLVKKTIELGLAGDVVALKICMDRLLPPLKSRPLRFKLPELRTVSDALSALAAIAEGLSNGQLLPEEGEVLSATVERFIKAVEVTMLEDRLSALERARDEGHAATGSQYDA